MGEVVGSSKFSVLDFFFCGHTLRPCCHVSFASVAEVVARAHGNPVVTGNSGADATGVRKARKLNLFLRMIIDRHRHTGVRLIDTWVLINIKIYFLLNTLQTENSRQTINQ